MIDFHAFCRADEKRLLSYMKEAAFGDVTFRCLYAWQPMFDYRLGEAAGFPVATGVSKEGIRSYILYRKKEEAPDPALEVLLQHILELGETELMLEYIPESELDVYRAAAERMNLKFSASYDERFSDYLYLREDFLSLEGQKNKSRRGDDRALHRELPKLRMVPYTPALQPVCMGIFQDWCSNRNCAECFNGCERQAFSRFLEVYDPEDCFGFISYDKDEPLSFLIGEKLGGEMYDHHFQKNRKRIRGLTAYVGRFAAALQPEGTLVNLEEDMGIPGLRMDKEKLHPCRKADKYTLHFRKCCEINRSCL